jgi:serine/threonine protein kinase/Tfp pilus assembly protein PilF
LIGQTVGHFKVIEKVGSGGMGVVYKARDLRLDRLVALKFLPPAASDDREAVTRLIREARTASALDHPNICTIYEVSQTPEGQMFIAMGYYEGITLAQRLRQGTLPIEMTLNIATEVAQGLAKAHRHGVIHRDVKPGNIMLTAEGAVKILDFGIAKFGESLSLTRTGTTVGTIFYMSPEHLRGGGPVDQRVDVWAWAVVLYEMLTGRLPFHGKNNAATIRAILHDQPDLGFLLSGGAPSGLIRILSRALAKNPEDRYSEMGSALAELQAMDHAVERATPSIAVLPFRNLSRDPEDEYFSDGLTEELTGALTRLEGLRVASRTSAFSFKGSRQSLTEIGSKLRVGLVLEGSVRRSGKRLRITVQLTNVATESGLWSQAFDRELEDVFAIQEEIAASVVDALKLRLGDQTSEHLVKRYTQNLKAYNLYLKGRQQWNRSTPEALQKAVESFEKAATEDPSYPLPFCGLADCYFILGSRAIWPPGQAWLKAKEAVLRALELDPTLAEAHSCYGAVLSISDFDWAGAEREFKEALALDPNSGSVHHWYAMCVLTPQGRLEEAVRTILKAVELEPLSMIFNSSAGWIFNLAGDFQRAVEQSLKALELEPNYLMAHWCLSASYRELGRQAEALAALEKAKAAAAPDEPVLLSSAGHLFARIGKREEAKEMLRRLEEIATRRYVSPIHRAWVYAQLNDADRAFECLEAAYENRDFLIRVIHQSRALAPLHGDPRFAALLQKMGLADAMGGDRTTTVFYRTK